MNNRYKAKHKVLKDIKDLDVLEAYKELKETHTALELCNHSKRVYKLLKKEQVLLLAIAEALDIEVNPYEQI